MSSSRKAPSKKSDPPAGTKEQSGIPVTGAGGKLPVVRESGIRPRRRRPAPDKSSSGGRGQATSLHDQLNPVDSSGDQQESVPLVNYGPLGRMGLAPTMDDGSRVGDRERSP